MRGAVEGMVRVGDHPARCSLAAEGEHGHDPEYQLAKPSSARAHTHTRAHAPLRAQRRETQRAVQIGAVTGGRPRLAAPSPDTATPLSREHRSERARGVLRLWLSRGLLADAHAGGVVRRSKSESAVTGALGRQPFRAANFREKRQREIGHRKRGRESVQVVELVCPDSIRASYLCAWNCRWG